MTSQPTPEAVEAVAQIVPLGYTDRDPYRNTHEASAAILAFIRDAIHRDGADADAIRQALGLRRERRLKPHGFGGQYGGERGEIHRVVGEWQEVQP